MSSWTALCFNIISVICSCACKLHLAREAPVAAEMSTKTARSIRQENGRKLHSSTHHPTIKEEETNCRVACG
eukprot:13098-Heterococcus_DN1.PRE.6